MEDIQLVAAPKGLLVVEDQEVAVEPLVVVAVCEVGIWNELVRY